MIQDYASYKIWHKENIYQNVKSKSKTIKNDQTLVFFQAFKQTGLYSYHHLSKTQQMRYQMSNKWRIKNFPTLNSASTHRCFTIIYPLFFTNPRLSCLSLSKKIGFEKSKIFKKMCLGFTRRHNETTPAILTDRRTVGEENRLPNKRTRNLCLVSLKIN